MVNNKTAKFFSTGVFISVLVTSLCLAGCRQNRDTEVVIENGNPIKFIVSGPGTIIRLKVTGPDIEHEPNRQGDKGEYLPLMKVYWELVSSETAANRRLDEIGPITYGKVPDGFVQTYPEHGAPPPIIDRDLYNITLSANNGRGVNMFFSIRDGKIIAEGER